MQTPSKAPETFEFIGLYVNQLGNFMDYGFRDNDAALLRRRLRSALVPSDRRGRWTEVAPGEWHLIPLDESGTWECGDALVVRQTLATDAPAPVWQPTRTKFPPMQRNDCGRPPVPLARIGRPVASADSHGGPR